MSITSHHGGHVVSRTTPAAGRCLIAALAGLMGLACGIEAGAQTTWVPTSGTNAWTDPANWSAGVPDAVGAVATFPNAAGASLISTTVTTGTLSTTNTSAGVVIGDTATTDDIVTLEVASGTPRVNVANSNATLFMYATIEGTQGFEKTGAGKFTFRFNPADQSYSGNTLISGGILGIERNGSLGNDANGITIATGARLLAEPGSNSGTITLPATRTITLAGAQSQLGAGNAAVNLVIQGSIGESGTGQGLVKTDAGVVTLEGTLSYTGETRIAGGTLALGGSALLPAGQNLRFTQAVGTLDVGSTSQTVRTIVMDNTAGNKTITGAGGSLLVNGDANQGFSGTVNGVVYDLSGLGSFTYNRANRDFGASANGANVTSTLNFAAGTNVVTATNIRLGGGGSNVAGQMTLIGLGQANTWNAGTDIFIGNFQGSGSASFQAGLTNPVLTVRGGAGGSTAVPLFRVANTSSGNQPTTGVLDLTGGSLDVIATEMSVGYHTAGANTAATGTLTMPGGTVVATTLNVAGKSASSGIPTVVGTLNQSGGTVTADSVYLGAHLGTTAATFTANYNLSSGTLSAATIAGLGATFNASTVRNLNLDGGTVRNKSGDDLTINGVDATTGGRLNVTLGAAGGTFEAESGRSITFGANTTLSGAGGLTKTGAGTLVVGTDATYVGTTTVSAGSLRVNGVLLGTSGATVASGATMGGSGRVAATLGGAGRIGPGNSAGILTAAQIDPTGGLGFDFEFTEEGVVPTWSTATASVNDVLRLSDGSAPFTGSLTGANGVNVFLGVTSLAAGDTFTGGFFTDASSDFLASVANAVYSYFVLGDGQGSAITYDGASYYTLAEFAPDLSIDVTTIPIASANFADGTITNGVSTQFQIVPEPSTLALAAAAAAGILSLARRRRRGRA